MNKKIKKWLRAKNPLNYWTSYRRWEDSMKTAEYLEVCKKGWPTLAWLIWLSLPYKNKKVKRWQK